MKTLIILFAASTAYADEPSKEQCVDAHSRGQDAKANGQLTLAKKLFFSCAQSACPAIVQSDCARFADDLGRMQPSLSFAARDGAGADLPDTTVYVDDQLVATRLDDGKPHEVDPGKHTVRFEHAGKSTTETVVVGTGEQGRAVVATFRAPGQKAIATTQDSVVVRHPAGSKIAIYSGLGLMAVGAGLGLWGMMSVPGNCSIGEHTCAAAPGDPVFDKASSGMRTMDIGMVVGGVGIAALAGGLFWYLTGAHSDHEVVPWASGNSAGVSFTVRL